MYYILLIIYTKILTRQPSIFGLALCLLASKNLEKTEVGATKPRKNGLRRLWGFETAPRALREASRCLQKRSGRLQDGHKSAPGGSKTVPRALREAPRRLHERSGRLQDVPRALREASRRPEERSGRLKTAFRAFREASRRPEKHIRSLETAQECSGRLHDDSAP